MEIFKLFGSIFVDNESANKKIDETDKKGKGVANTLGSMIGTAAKWGAGIAAGAGAAGAALLATANKAAETTDRVDKMSQKLGMSRQAFQEWDFILSQNGASIDGLGAGMKTLTNQVDELSKGGKVATDAFSALGMKYEDMQGLSQEQIFEKVIVALQGVEDTTKRAALANDLLGRSGQELGPLLNAGSGSVDALKTKAQELGLVLSDQAVDAGVKFTDTMDQLKRSFGAVFTQVGTAVMPIMQSLAEWVIAHMPEVQSIFSTVFGVIEGVVQRAGDVITWLKDTVFQPFKEAWETGTTEMQSPIQTLAAIVGDSIYRMTEVIQDIMDWAKKWYEDNEEKLKGIQDKFSGAFEAINELISAFMEWATAFWEEYGQSIMNIIGSVWDTITTIFDVALTLITDIFNIFSALFRGDWEAVWEGIKTLFSDIWDGIGKILSDVIETIKSTVSLAWEWIKDTTSGIFEGVKTVLSDIWNGIVNMIKGNINFILKAINGLIRGINKIQFDIPDWVPLLGGKKFGINIPEIPLLADGGNILKSGMAIVGEQGPELLNLPRGAQVTPLSRSNGIVFERGAFEGAIIMDDYGVDRLMDRIKFRLGELGV